MGRHFLPQADAAARAWMLHFIDVLASRAGALGICAQDVEATRLAVLGFDAALEKVEVRMMCTSLDVALKNQKRDEARRLCRQVAAVIRANPRIGDDERLELGLPLREKARPLPPLSEAPALAFIAAVPGFHILRFWEHGRPHRPGRPANADCLALHRAIGREQAADPGEASFVLRARRNPVRVECPDGPPGRFATYFARWEAKGAQSCWSLPASAPVTPMMLSKAA